MVTDAYPAELTHAAAGRIAHVHLNDVDGELAVQVRLGRLGYTEAVRAGLYQPLGTGTAQVAEVVRALESRGYAGWYVLEQDVVLAGPDEAARAQADVRASLAYLVALA